MTRSQQSGRSEEELDRARGILVSAEDSDGAFALIEYEIPPRVLLAPLHTHRREDEYSYVLRGSIGAQVGEHACEVGVHRLIAKPRGVPHTLWNPRDVPARVLELIVPGGFERCLAELYRPGRRASPARLRELWVEYGIEMQPDSVAGLLSAHGLRGALTSA